jgi:RNA polymerase sigma-70 factor, ECF subfamily
MPDDSEILISQASQGDEHAVGTLLERHLPVLRAYIRMRMGPGIRRWETESDVAQSVCLEALKNLDSFTYRGDASFLHWLFKATRHKLVERHRHYRAAKRDTGLLVTRTPWKDADLNPVGQEICRAVGSPSQHAIRQETLEGIENALDSMSEDAREVVLLSRLAGLSNPEIARTLGKKESVVRSILCRTLVKLARVVGD